MAWKVTERPASKNRIVKQINSRGAWLEASIWPTYLSQPLHYLSMFRTTQINVDENKLLAIN